jgi:hypothetical protein
MDPRAVRWMTPSEIVSHGFATSPVVMMNEAHNGMTRCARTRRIGREILPAAHDAGCRHLAMEALPNMTAGPTVGVVALPDGGYVAQPEMRGFIDAALELGWTLVAYEISYHDGELSMESTNRRELVQAENLVSAWRAVDAPMLVWCGNSHHAKRPAMEWTPMGARFIELAGVEHFAIDQTLTVAFTPDQPPCIELTDSWRAELDARGGTAGFVIGDVPEGLDMWFGPLDALILSTDNEMVDETPWKK